MFVLMRVKRECGLWCAIGAPQMRGALMSARYDMEAAEPDMGQLRERVELMRVHPACSVEVRPLSGTGLRPAGWVA